MVMQQLYDGIFNIIGTINGGDVKLITATQWMVWLITWLAIIGVVLAIIFTFVFLVKAFSPYHEKKKVVEIIHRKSKR